MKTTITKTDKGFTLVELLVVIAIIAILSTIGLTLYSTAQGNARDARRKSDVDAIASAIESTRTPGTTTYSAVTAANFSSGVIPVDTTTSKYCIAYTTATTQPAGEVWATTAWNSTDACPNVGTGYTAPTPAWTGPWATTGPIFTGQTASTTFWKVCARLELNGTPYCKSSGQ